LVLPTDRTRSDSCFPSPTITSLYENTNENNPIEELLQKQESEHQQQIIQDLKQAHSEQKRVLELEIKELNKRLETRPPLDLIEQALEMQKELKNEIESLSGKLSEADLELVTVTTLGKTMIEKRQSLELEIVALQRKLEEDTVWKHRYKQANITHVENEAKLLSEIKRLEEEVTDVFRIGRRLSDELVIQLDSELKEKEEQVENLRRALKMKDDYVIHLEDERGSLRKMLKISVGLTRERLQSRLLRLRTKIRSGIVTTSSIMEKTTTDENASLSTTKQSQGSTAESVPVPIVKKRSRSPNEDEKKTMAEAVPVPVPVLKKR